MARRGWLGKILFAGVIITIVSKYVYLIVPAVLTLIVAMIIRKRKNDKVGDGRLIYIRQR